MGILFVFMVILQTLWVFTFSPLLKTFNSLHKWFFYNATMSEVRVAVEWLFGNITNYFKFIDFKSQLQINLSSVGKFYIVCALLENALTCLYGNIVLEKFEVQPPSLQDYIQEFEFVSFSILANRRVTLIDVGGLKI